MWSCYIAIIYYFKRTTIHFFVIAVLFISPQAVHEGSGFPISSPALVIWGECDASCLSVCETRYLIVTLIVSLVTVMSKHVYMVLVTWVSLEKCLCSFLKYLFIHVVHMCVLVLTHTVTYMWR